MENDIGVDSGDDIIQYHPESSPYFFETADGEGFENIEKPEKNETSDNEQGCLGNPEHCNEEAYHLIDDDSLVVCLAKILLCLSRTPARKEEEGDEWQLITRE